MESEEFKQLFGERLRTIRREKGLSQEQLAEVADINPRYLSRIELGQALPSVYVAWRLAKALPTPIEALLDGAPPRGVAQLRLLLDERTEEEVGRVLRVVEALLN